MKVGIDRFEGQYAICELEDSLSLGRLNYMFAE